VAQIKDFATTNQQINAVVPNENVCENYIFSLLESKADSIRKMAAQQAVPIINKTTFSNIEMLYPAFDEQKQIGAYFSTLDHLIALHQRKSEDHRELKRFMLQNMFPSNDD
jgi:type I restriction enzyme S subunit